MSINTQPPSKIIHLDTAIIHTLANSMLADSIEKTEIHQRELIENFDHTITRIAELTTSVAALQAQEAKLTAERNSANAKADKAQLDMVEALSEGRDITTLRKAYSESISQSTEAHGVLSSVEKALNPQRQKLADLKAELNALNASIRYAENAVAVRDCRLVLAELVRQILDFYPERTLTQVIREMSIFGISLESLPRQDLSLRDDPRQALERDWAELDAMDQAAADGVKAFIMATDPVDSPTDGVADTADLALEQAARLNGTRKPHARNAKPPEIALAGDAPVIGAEIPDSDE